MKSNLESNNKKLELRTNYIESIRKIAVDIFLFLVVVVVTFAVIRNAVTKQLLIYPFKVPKTLTDQGITGEILTSRVVDRIHTIKNSSLAFYKSNKVELPSWENQIDEFKNDLGSDSYGGINAIVKFLIGNKSESANGEITTSRALNDTLQMYFRMGGQNDCIALKDKSIDTLINRAAEFIMEKADPYYLAAWYMKTGQKARGLKLVQQMLNDDDPKNDGLAMHLQGSILLSQVDTASNNKGIQILTEALTKIESPWLTYNNLGVGYYYKGDYNKAESMYQASIKANPKTFGGYRNYGNLMYAEYGKDNKKVKQLDSSIQFFCKAIEYNKNDITEYISIFPALYARNRIKDANFYFEKAKEMDPGNYIIYFQMGQVQLKYRKYTEALPNLQQAYALCNNPSLKNQIGKIVEAVAGQATPALNKTKDNTTPDSVETKR